MIQAIADAVRQTLRATDIAGRYGGEEYAVLLVDTALDDAAVLAERLRQSVEAMLINYNEHKIKVTLSLGIAQYSSEMKEHRQWIEASDKALYRSKANGRNQVTRYHADE